MSDPQVAGALVSMRSLMANFPLARFQPVPLFPPNFVTETFQYLQIETMDDSSTFWSIIMMVLSVLEILLSLQYINELQSGFENCPVYPLFSLFYVCK
jgi:hypothetical protein